MTSAALVYGLAVTGVATTRALVARGWRVTVADDRVTDAMRTSAAELGVELVEAPTGASLTALVAISTFCLEGDATLKRTAASCQDGRLLTKILI